jgi:hypothetical protein
VPAALNQPPLDSPLLFRCMSLVAHPLNETSVDQSTYDYYVKTPRTITGTKTFIPYDEDSIQADFYRLWSTNFLDNLWIEVVDEPFENGVKASTSSSTSRNARASKRSTISPRKAPRPPSTFRRSRTRSATRTFT